MQAFECKIEPKKKKHKHKHTSKDLTRLFTNSINISLHRLLINDEIYP